MSKISKPGDNGGIVEYYTRTINPNSVKFFGVDDKIDPTDGINKEELVECKCCGKLLPWNHYNWVLKGTSKTLKKTLNSRTCKSCTNMNNKVVSEIKKKNPPPPKGTHCAIDGCENVDLHCDHNHRSNKFRGYICTQHNTGLGKLGDSIPEVIKCVKYLMETSDDTDVKKEAVRELKKLVDLYEHI